MKWNSSYEENDFGSLFYSIVRINKPVRIVELGTKDGYSAFHIARALEDNNLGYLYCYDLWEDYEFNSCYLETAKENLKDYENRIIFVKTDAREIEKKYTSVDILHIDLSNHGELLDEILIPWLPKAKLIIIEGGSEERDNVEWMKKYNKKPIKQWLEDHKHLFDYFTINQFPSVTLIKPKKIENERNK